MGILRASHLDGIWTAIVEDKFVVRSFTKRALFERLWWNDQVVFDAVHAEFCCTSLKKTGRAQRRCLFNYRANYERLNRTNRLCLGHASMGVRFARRSHV